MGRTQTMVQLTEELVARLDQEAERAGLSRSAVIRQAVEQYLAQRGHAAQLRRYAEGYERVPPTVPDAWGDSESAADRHGRELAQRLDAEDRQAGRTW